MVDFLGYELTYDDINEILETLPKRELNDVKGGGDQNIFKQSKFQGVIGDWFNYFSPEQSRQMDELFKAKFEKLGLSMSFDPTDALKRFQQFGRIIVNNNNENKNNNKQKRKKSDSSTINDKPELTKDEVSLLRNKSLSKMQMFSIESQPIAQDSCWRKFTRIFCNCFYY